MWKKLMFGIIIGVMLMTVSTGVIYGSQINQASSSSYSSSVLTGNGKGDGNSANQNGTGSCNGTGDCINENGTGSGNNFGNGTGDCTNGNCTGDCDGTGTGTGNGEGNGTGICNGTGDCDGTGDCTNASCVGNCNDGLIKQNGLQKSSNVNGVGAENKKEVSGYAVSNQNKNVERYEERFSFRNALARFLSFFKFGNNS
jgi:hypothetical protein